jgi:F-type H+-transporting ATPase subunit alpha
MGFFKEMFSHSKHPELDAASQAQLERGRRVVEILKQPQYVPQPVENQVLAIYTVTNGLADDIDVGRMAEFEAGLVDWFRTRHADLLATITEEGALPDEEALRAGIEAFKATFTQE